MKYGFGVDLGWIILLTDIDMIDNNYTKTFDLNATN